jgi:hypothetical protein
MERKFSLGLMLLAWASAAQAGGFGRWEIGLRGCSLRQGQMEQAQPLRQKQQDCVRLRLEQNMEGLLSVRLITPSANQLFGSRSLVFAGVLAPGQKPMRCGVDGECKPQWPIRLDVSTVATNLELDESPAPTLPLALLAKGTCLLEIQSLRCEASDSSGQIWEAQARL